MSIAVSVIVACTLQNYIKSNCVPEELLKMPVAMCIYQEDQ
jgi:hypothetical protein